MMNQVNIFIQAALRLKSSHHDDGEQQGLMLVVHLMRDWWPVGWGAMVRVEIQSINVNTKAAPVNSKMK